MWQNVHYFSKFEFFHHYYEDFHSSYAALLYTLWRVPLVLILKTLNNEIKLKLSRQKNSAFLNI